MGYLEKAVMHEYNPDAALATVLYIANRVNPADLHRVFKVWYFADKMHLEHYGRFIANDKYVAMRNGPVPDYTYNLLKTTKGNWQGLLSDSAKQFQHNLCVDGYYIRPKNDADLGYLSESDVECLNWSIATHGHKNFRQLTDESHDQAWHDANQLDNTMTVESIARTLPNSEELLEYLSDPHPG